MLSFASDYLTGAHPTVLQRLIETNGEQTLPYDEDVYTLRAAEKIRAAADCPHADVYLLAGGTQTNRTVIDTVLAPTEGVISATTGHIHLHEAGAIEAGGHKVFTLPSHEGKLKVSEVEAFLTAFWQDENRAHMVAPAMVYISHPTEYGTLYTNAELTALRELCDRFSLTLFMDGARLGYGLAGRGTDLDLPRIAALCHVFTVGGTKVGALCGEAVVYTAHNTPSRFMTSVKQHGALLAKGRLLGVQFDALFTDGLYLSLGRVAVERAERMVRILRGKGYRFLLETPTNQQFLILKNETVETLRQKVSFSYWEPYDEAHTVVRFATSWATTEEELDALEALL